MGKAEVARFRDRRHAGQALGWRLVDAGVLEYCPEPRVVLGLPRGGVPVAGEVARILAAPLDVFLVRKLGVPGQEELAMGAIASGGVQVLNQPVIERLGVTPDEVEAVARTEAEVLARREEAYRDGRPPVDVKGASVIVVDDGLATGASMRAALHAIRGGSRRPGQGDTPCPPGRGGSRRPGQGDTPCPPGRAQDPAAIVVAVPVGSVDTCRMLRDEADEVICMRMPARFLAVGQAYVDFSPTSDEEVRAVLQAVACASP